jgi:dTDP-4-dehydrorhamnose reductase
VKIAVIGANGQLGVDVCRAFSANEDDVVEVNHSDLDVSDPAAVRQVMGEIRPELVVNTTAMHHVERCEQEPAAAFGVNAIGPRNLAVVSNELDFALVHISTDYVFDGKKQRPYEESDQPAPLNVYGNSKLAGEHFVRTLSRRHFVLRTSALYGLSPCRAKGANFVELMLRLAGQGREIRVVDSECVTPTTTAQLARQIVRLSRVEGFGLYHATAEGSCTWHEFARTIFELAGCPAKLAVAGPDEFPAKVPRPTYSVLDNTGLKERGWNVFEPWQSGLQQYLDARPVAPNS